MEKKVIFEMTKDGVRAINLPGKPLVKFKMKNGVAAFENYSSGGQHSAHPNIDKSGNVKGMIANGGWRKTDKIVEAFGFKYNVSSVVCSCELDEICYRVEQGLPLLLPSEIGEQTTFSFD